MMSKIQRRVRLGLSSIAIASLAVVSLTTPAISAEDYSAPDAPARIGVSQATGGLKVYWSKVDGSPEITNYIISGGV
ncbi:MAG: hypothetical protein ACO33E_06315, partial [Aquiluna sp.]